MIEIKHGTFRLAGVKYKWPYKSEGVGVPKEAFEGEGQIKVFFTGKPEVYWIDKQKALEIVRRYKAFYSAKGLPLGIIPLDQFQIERRGQDSLNL